MGTKKLARMVMVKEKGMVETVSGGNAVVRIPRSSSCATCESRAACGIETAKEIRVEVINELHARPGDQVELSMPAPSLFKMGALVYLFPVFSLIVGAGAGSLSAGHLGVDTNLASITGGIAALGISFGVLRGMDRSARNRPGYHPRMTRIIQPPT